jgi:hypothetical protein
LDGQKLKNQQAFERHFLKPKNTFLPSVTVKSFVPQKTEIARHAAFFVV